tara:strand:+ start:443 stop:553 length:111 start_codon:yes stop_codon:yes gene_type:complete
MKNIFYLSAVLLSVSLWSPYGHQDYLIKKDDKFLKI